MLLQVLLTGENLGAEVAVELGRALLVVEHLVLLQLGFILEPHTTVNTMKLLTTFLGSAFIFLHIRII